MKKVLLVAAVVALGFTSCSKKSDYTCSCEASGVSTEVTIPDAKESDAEDACEALEQSVFTCTLAEI